jgi:hypothetical protein
MAASASLPVKKNAAGNSDRHSGIVVTKIWLRGRYLNPRPSGYEPDELPGCSTPRVEDAETRIKINLEMTSDIELRDSWLRSD